jgi:cytochrome P450
MIVASRPPGPPGHWLLGHLPEFRRDKLAFYTRLAREFGNVASFRLGWHALALVSHPDAIEQLLVTDHRNFVKPYIYQLLRPTLGNGLLLSEGAFWLRQRRLLQPAFHKQRIDTYAPIVVEYARRLLDRIDAGKPRDLHDDMMQLTANIVTKALLDVDVSDHTDGVAEALDCMMHDFSARFESVWQLPVWVPTPTNLRLKRARGVLNAVIHKIIQQRRAAGGDRGDLLSMLIQARDENNGVMTDRQLRDEVMTLFLAGHETTANALSWTWYLLAQHPEVEDKLRAELQSVLADRTPTAQDLPRLPYTERVVLESMRLYPPVYGFSRQAVEPCTIGGFAIPAGTTLIMAQWVLHRDPRWFPDPERFNPDRWTPEFTKQLPKYVYIPFGAGPRVCIGNTFAMMEAILVLAVLAPHIRFRLVAEHPVIPWPSITLRPKHGIQATAERI